MGIRSQQNGFFWVFASLLVGSAMLLSCADDNPESNGTDEDDAGDDDNDDDNDNSAPPVEPDAVVVGNAPSVQASANGDVAIAFTSTETEFPCPVVAVLVNDNWFFITGAGPLLRPSLRMDEDGILYVSYFSSVPQYGLSYGTNKDGQWVFDWLIYVDGGRSTSIELDEEGRPFIAYLSGEQHPEGGWFLTYIGYFDVAARTNEMIVPEAVVSYVDNPQTTCSLRFDVNGNPHVVMPLYDEAADLLIRLGHAEKAQQGWQTEVADSSDDSARSASFEIDSKGVFHVSYGDGRGQYPNMYVELKHARKTTGPWESETLDTVTWDYAASPLTVGFHTDLAIDEVDAVYVVYGDDVNQLLKLATNRTGEWVISVLDEKGGMEPSAAFGPDGALHVAYVRNGWILYQKFDVSE